MLNMEENKRVIIVSLYMDDLIYTNNDLQMIDELKQIVNGVFYDWLGKNEIFIRNWGEST